jgi:hypothetical protein
MSQTRGLVLAHKLPVERWIDNSALVPRRRVRWIHLDLVSTRCRDRLPRPTIISLGIPQWTIPAVDLPTMQFCLLYFKRSHSLYVAVNAIQEEFLSFLYIVGLRSRQMYSDGLLMLRIPPETFPDCRQRGIQEFLKTLYPLRPLF